MRGGFDGAQAEAEMALMGSSAERIHVLIRLADIALYLGDFSQIGYVILVCCWCSSVTETDFRSLGHRPGRLLRVS